MFLKTHTVPNHFGMPEYAKARLQQCRISFLFGGEPPHRCFPVRGKGEETGKVEKGKSEGKVGSRERKGEEAGRKENGMVDWW